MAVNDVKIVKHAGPALELLAEDRDTASYRSASMKPGEPVVKGGTGGNFAEIVNDGGPLVGSHEFIGIVKKESTETSSADGTVEVATIVPGLTVLRANATTSANINTQAKINALVGDWVCFDWDGTNFTIDEDEGDDPNTHSLKILDGDPVAGTLDVLVHALATIAAPLVGQTMD